MKKAFVIAGILAIGLSSQRVNAQAITIGPKIGLNVSHFGYTGNYDERIEQLEENRESIAGLQVGAVANISINDMFSVQPEILFSQKGTKKVSEVPDEGEYKQSTIFNNIEVPVLARLSFGPENAKVFINAGPYAAFALNGKYKAEFRGEENEEDLEFDYTDDKESDSYRKHNKRLDFGLAAGAGVGIKLGSGTLTIEGRYSYGLTDIYEYTAEAKETFKAAFNDEIPKTSNRTWGISVSYMFGLGN